MKTILVILFGLLITFQANDVMPDMQTRFCIGWEDGYVEGWCYQQGPGCFEPYVPYCPYPNWNEDQNSYRDGYNRGFATAINDR